VEFKELTPLTVLLGPNGSGKSTVFDVFAFLAECFDVPKLPYLTRLDAFILASSLLVFLSLIEVMLTTKLATNNRTDLARTIDRRCRIFSHSPSASLPSQSSCAKNAKHLHATCQSNALLTALN
jgi:hypothetical protein